MHETWNAHRGVVDAVNELWKEGENLRRQYEAKREEAAKQLEALFAAMTTEAKRVHGDIPVRLDMIVENSELAGVKVWMHDQSQLFRI